MSNPCEVSEEMLKAADEYWLQRKLKVLETALKAGLNISIDGRDILDMNKEDFMYDLFDYGEYEPTEDEIERELHEWLYGVSEF